MKRRQWAALLLVVVVALAFQGSRGLYETTEGRYAEAAREMAAGGDWLTPHLDGNPHWTKPPFTYWALAAGIEALGRNGWGLRAFNALAFIGMAMGVYGIGRALWDESTGLLAMLIAATAPFSVLGLNSISTDMPLALWETLAVLCFWLAMRTGRARYVNAMWASFGLAFLTKGPPGLLALLAILVFVWARRGRDGGAPRLARVEGIAAFLVIAFGWYALQVARDPSLARYLVHDELYGRMATGMHHRNARWFMPLVIYGPALTLGLGLWFFDAFPLGARAWRNRRVRRAALSPETGFALLWLTVPLVVLSMSRSRLPLYVLPLMAPAALGLAHAALTLRPRERALRRGVVLAVAGGVLCIALKGVAARVPSASNMAQLRDAVAASPGERVIAVDAGRLYGLDFYLDGRLERVDSAHLTAALADGRPAVLVLPRGAAPLLDGICAMPGVRCENDTTSSRYYRVCRMEGAVLESDTMSGRGAVR